MWIAWVLLAWALLVAVLDWRTRRIANVLLLLALLPAAAVLIFTPHGLLGVERLPSVWGLSCGLLLTLPGYWAHQLGAGDVKLAAVMGLLLGWPWVGWMLLAAALLLGLMSLMAVLHWGLGAARNMRLPGGVALAGGFAATLLAIEEAWI